VKAFGKTLVFESFVVENFHRKSSNSDYLYDFIFNHFKLYHIHFILQDIGAYLNPPQLEVANCDLKISNSLFDSSKISMALSKVLR
jgi:hypothetical protein